MPFFAKPGGVAFGQRQGIDDDELSQRLSSVNIMPESFGSGADDGTLKGFYSFDYSTDPGHVGRMGTVYNDINNLEEVGTKTWIPSKYDFTGAKYDENTSTYYLPTGEVIKGYNPKTDSFSFYYPSAPNNIFQNKMKE
jgi:hypothetical protein